MSSDRLIHVMSDETVRNSRLLFALMIREILNVVSVNITFRYQIQMVINSLPFASFSLSLSLPLTICCGCPFCFLAFGTATLPRGRFSGGAGATMVIGSMGSTSPSLLSTLCSLSTTSYCSASSQSHSSSESSLLSSSALGSIILLM
jgi:hypothetical protein